MPDFASLPSPTFRSSFCRVAMVGSFFDLIFRVEVPGGSTPWTPGDFLLLVQKKVTKEKDPPVGNRESILGGLRNEARFAGLAEMKGLSKCRLRRHSAAAGPLKSPTRGQTKATANSKSKSSSSLRLSNSPL